MKGKEKVTVNNLFQMKPTRCTLLLSIFVSTSVHVSGNYVLIISRTYCFYATLVFFTLYGWLSGRLVGLSLIPTSRPDNHPAGWEETNPSQPTRQPPIHSKKYQCRMDTVNSPDDGQKVARNM